MITELLSLQNQLRIFHWQTKSYAQHQAFGLTYESLDDHIDTFVEVFSGKYSHISSKEYSIVLHGLTSDEAILEFVDGKIEYLVKGIPKILKDTDTDLLNIRDEMLADLNKLKYLLSLK